MNNIDLRGLLARGFGWISAEAGREDRPARGWNFWQGLPLVVAVPALLVTGTGVPGALGNGSRDHLEGPIEVLAATLPLHVNERVDRWVKRFRTDQRVAFQRLLDRQGAYDELIRGRLRDRGMPEELLYLAMMESGLSNRAVSSASAVGLWQFMGPTAQQYGLRVDEWVDERRDPVRATDAALDYLAFLHERYGSWYLAAAAYNAGPGTVDRVLNRYAGGRTGDEELYWEVLDHLPRETRDYVPRLVAATLLAEAAVEEGFEVDRDDPYVYERVFVPGGTSLARVAWLLQLEPRVLRNLNPHLLQGATPPGETYPIRVPPGHAGQVVAMVGRAGRARRAG